MRLLVGVIVVTISMSVFAFDKGLPEMTEECVYDAYTQFRESPSGIKVRFDAVVTDGGGYGIYKEFSLKAVPPFIGILSFDGNEIAAIPENGSMKGLARLMVKVCGEAANK